MSKTTRRCSTSWTAPAFAASCPCAASSPTASTRLSRICVPSMTEAFKKALRKRAVWVEPLFGGAKDWHQLRRFRLRGLEQVNIQGLLVAAGQNLKRWLAAVRRDHRPAVEQRVVTRCAFLCLP